MSPSLPPFISGGASFPPLLFSVIPRSLLVFCFVLSFVPPFGFLFPPQCVSCLCMRNLRVKKQRDLRRDRVVDHDEQSHLNLEAAELCAPEDTPEVHVHACVYFASAAPQQLAFPAALCQLLQQKIPGDHLPSRLLQQNHIFIAICVKDRQSCCHSSSSSVKRDTAAISKTSHTCRCRLVEASGASRQQCTLGCFWRLQQA